MHDWICKVALYRLCTPIHPRTLLHIPSAPLYRLCTPIYPRTFYIYPLLPCIVLLLPYIAVPSTSTLYSLVSSSYSHISPYPSTYPLYSLVSSLYSHTPRTLLHISLTPLYRLYCPCTLIYPYGFLHFLFILPFISFLIIL